MGENWCLGESLFLQEHWEWESSGVLGVDLFDLNLSVGKEVIEDVVLVTTIVGSVLPENVENEYFSIIIKEAFKSFVWSSSLEFDFEVVLHLSLIWWGLFHVDHGSGMSEKISWISLRSIKCNSFIGIESSGEVITVDDSENSSVDVEVHAEIEVSPGVVLGLVIWEWELVSLKEDSLWDTRVLNSWFNYVDGVIIEIVIDDALSHPEVLVWIFNDWFLVKSIE